jgi:hypothetical protein
MKSVESEIVRQASSSPFTVATRKRRCGQSGAEAARSTRDEPIVGLVAAWG